MNKATNLGARLMGIGCLIMLLMILVPILLVVLVFVAGMAGSSPGP